MPTGGTVLLLCILALQITPTHQSWWLSDTEFVYNVDHGGADIYDVITRNTTRVPFSSAINESSSLSYSRNLKYTAEYIKLHDTSLYPDKTQFSMAIHDESENMQYDVGPSSGYEIQEFKWSHGSAYACKFDDDIYYVPSPGQTPTRVTFTNDKKPEIGRNVRDAKPGYVRDIDDEGKYGRMWFSPKDDYLAYLSSIYATNYTTKMTAYNRANQCDYQYDAEIQPLAGTTPTSVWNVSIWSVEEKKSIEFELPLANSSVAFPLILSWVVLHGQELLFVAWTNRWLNETAITLCSYDNATCSLLYEHKYEHGQWATEHDYSSMVHSDSAIFIILPEATEDNAWQHIAKLEISADFQLDSVSFLPAEEYDIRDIVAYRSLEDVIVKGAINDTYLVFMTHKPHIPGTDMSMQLQQGRVVFSKKPDASLAYPPTALSNEMLRYLAGRMYTLDCPVMVYPKDYHSITGKALKHYYQLLKRFLSTCYEE